MKGRSIPVFSLVLAMAFSATSAYTLSGTVKNEAGDPVKDASVRLLAKQDSATTDADGKFEIEFEEESDAIANAGGNPGYIDIVGGVLHFSQSPDSPVHVAIYDMTGHQVLSQTLKGKGQVDLHQGVDAQGVYLARVRVGSVQQTIKFTADGRYAASFRANQGKALLKAEDDTPDTLVVTAADYDTLKVYLPKLDTSLTLTLTKPVIEQTYAFGYAMGNAPTPSKGCGKENTLKDNFTFTSDGIEHEIYLTMPENYDKDKPYRLVFGMHYMGGSAKNVATREAYYGLRNQKGA